jgi:high-affinity nickel permease
LKGVDGAYMHSELGIVAAIAMGLLLGLKHATDADHVVAVATIVRDTKNAWRSIWIGISWGFGHSTPLIILGILILILDDHFLYQYEGITRFFEFVVGLMLVFLGVQVFWNIKKGKLHMHYHSHDARSHVHIHSTHAPSEPPEIERLHGVFKFGKPFFRFKSYIIGMIHGLAGTAVVMLALLPTIDSFWFGLAYLILFGIGSIVSMSLITIVLSLPFSMTSNYKTVNYVVINCAAIVSIAFGFALMADVAMGTSLVPF